MQNRNLHRRILVPSGVGLAILLATCVVSIRQVQLYQVRETFETNVDGVRQHWRFELDVEARVQGSLLKLLRTDQASWSHGQTAIEPPY